MKVSYDYTVTLTRAEVAKIVTDLIKDQIPPGYEVQTSSLDAHCSYTDYGNNAGWDIDFKVAPPKPKTTKKKKTTKK